MKTAPLVATSHVEYTDLSVDIDVPGGENSIGCTIVLADEEEAGVLSCRLPYSIADLDYPVLSSGEYQFALGRILAAATTGIARVIVYFG